MVLVKKRNYKKIILISTVIVILLIVGGYIIYDTFIPSADVNANLNINSTRGLPIIIQFGEELFDEQRYKNLEGFGDDKLPIDLRNINKSRKDPFQPSY